MVKVINKIFTEQAESAVVPAQKKLEPDVKIKPFSEFLDKKTMTAYLVSAGRYGGQAVLDKLKIDLAFDGFDKKIVDRLSKQANLLITTVDETTKERIATIISEGREAGLNPNEIRNLIVERFKEISYDRADMIVHAETANAIGTVELITAKQNGIKKKRWITSHDDLVSEGCWENEQAGEIAIDADFPSGDQAPPRHPRCRCYVDEIIDDDYINTDPYIG